MVKLGGGIINYMHNTTLDLQYTQIIQNQIRAPHPVIINHHAWSFFIKQKVEFWIHSIEMKCWTSAALLSSFSQQRSQQLHTFFQIHIVSNPKLIIHVKLQKMLRWRLNFELWMGSSMMNEIEWKEWKCQNQTIISSSSCTSKLFITSITTIFFTYTSAYRTHDFLAIIEFDPTIKRLCLDPNTMHPKHADSRF